jgi:hypothetical protein
VGLISVITSVVWLGSSFVPSTSLFKPKGNTSVRGGLAWHGLLRGFVITLGWFGLTGFTLKWI